ncbi:hypothetical protein BO71DRAFT_487132 [Aspergillus ellipticus CBS 707.79]|uniref:Peptidase A1 domain-containing protein n=1 Tax=Aspergillus ellipticus CBS 707.79 TaxID=1448320 RepID=A0A319CYQ8_9EURO|nr:hypothetical protein BO71DRAFT_487132 [Aspergillus ellipticus CBS 707.79]
MYPLTVHWSCLLVVSAVCTVSGTSPYALRWSDKSFGPDGPWHAVSVAIGNPGQDIALYPGGSWESQILLTSTCDNTTVSSVCYGNYAGLFNNGASDTYDNSSIQLLINYAGPGKLNSFGMADAIPLYGEEGYAYDYVDLFGSKVPNVSMFGISGIYQTYPGGQNYPVEVGVLAFGGPSINQSFANTGSASINTSLINGYLYSQGTTASNSYGLHIGSVNCDISGSALLGGYDQSRVLGDVSAQAYNSGSFPIQLLDINIGVVSGGSPWTYSNKSGLLGENNSTLSLGTTVHASPPDPYIYLPQSTCDAIASELPVTYQSDFGLYFWNTSDHRYSQIVTASTYLGFTFRKNSLNIANITIKVPFALLNLTLAAFVGVNWGTGTGNWFLAQAPGPNMGTSTPVTIQEADTTIKGSSSSWEDSWAPYWTELPASSTSSTAIATAVATHQSTAKESAAGGLSVGAKIAIAVPCSVAAIGLVISAVWFLYRRRSRKQVEELSKYTAVMSYRGSKTDDPGPRYELGLGRAPRYELGLQEPNRVYELS